MCSSTSTLSTTVPSYRCSLISQLHGETCLSVNKNVLKIIHATSANWKQGAKGPHRSPEHLSKANLTQNVKKSDDFIQILHNTFVVLDFSLFLFGPTTFFQGIMIKLPSVQSGLSHNFQLFFGGGGLNALPKEFKRLFLYLPMKKKKLRKLPHNFELFWPNGF